MYRIIIACGLLSIAAAAVIPSDSEAQIIKYENTNDGAGNYKFSYETSNGIAREETGYLVNVGQEDEHLVVKGRWSYTDVEGKLVVFSYTADENGYVVNQSPGGPTIPQIPYGLPPSVVATLLG